MGQDHVAEAPLRHVSPQERTKAASSKARLPKACGLCVALLSFQAVGRCAATPATGGPAESRLYRSYDVYLTYTLRQPSELGTIMDPGTLSGIAHFERRLRESPEWRLLCNRTEGPHQSLCNLGVSAANYARPTARDAAPPGSVPSGQPSGIAYDGMGPDALPTSSIIRLLERHSLEEIVLPLDFDESNLSSVVSIRSAFRFKMLWCSVNDSPGYSEPVLMQMNADWEDFVRDILRPAMRLHQEEGNASFTVDFFSNEPKRASRLQMCTPSGRFSHMDEAFPPQFAPPPPLDAVRSLGVAEPDAGISSTGQNSALFWCDATSEQSAQTARTSPQEGVADASSGGGADWISSDCVCYRAPASDCTHGMSAHTVVRRVVGLPDYISPEDVDNMSFSRPGDAASGTAGEDDISSSSPRLGRLLVRREGAVAVEPVVQVVASSQRRNDLHACGWREACFCGAATCRLPEGWAPAGGLVVAHPGRQHRRPAPRRTRPTLVHVTWGMLPVADMEEFNTLLDGHEHGPGPRGVRPSFTESFRPQVPDVQRDLYALCMGLPADLRVLEHRCWVEDFREWLRSQRSRFPVPWPGFHEMTLNFISSPSATRTVSCEDRRSGAIWFDNETVRAFSASFEVDIDPCEESSELLEYKEKWDSYIQQWNTNTLTEARGAWHISNLWDNIDDGSMMSGATRIRGGIALGAMAIATAFFPMSLVP